MKWGYFKMYSKIVEHIMMIPAWESTAWQGGVDRRENRHPKGVPVKESQTLHDMVPVWWSEHEGWSGNEFNSLVNTGTLKCLRFLTPYGRVSIPNSHFTMHP